MHASSVNFSAMALCSLAISFTGCIALITHHWSSLEISEDEVTPLTTATGGYKLKGSYHTGLFQFCMKNPSDGHYRTCYGITMPMDFHCQGPAGDIVRTGSALYLRLTCIRVCMITGILIALASSILSAIGSFKKRKHIYLWCAVSLAILQTGLFASACGLYGHTEAYWYKCGHNQCGGVFRCLFSFGYSYALAAVCMFMSFVVLGYLWSMRRDLPDLKKKSEKHEHTLKNLSDRQEIPKNSMSICGQIVSSPLKAFKNIKTTNIEPSIKLTNVKNYKKNIETSAQPNPLEDGLEHVVHIDKQDTSSSESSCDNSSIEE